MEECKNSVTRGVEFVGMRPLKVIMIRRLVSGKESVSYNFSPGARGVPDEFLIIPDVAWRECGVGDLSGSVRRYVESLSGDGERVESYVSDSGIVCFELAFNGERRSLWFNFHTSDSVVLDAEGKVCDNIRRAICGGDFESLSVPESRLQAQTNTAIIPTTSKKASSAQGYATSVALATGWLGTRKQERAYRMTAHEMQVKQKNLHEEIRIKAIRLGYDPDVIAPIYDGVVDLEKYLMTAPRVMWILKEPYDDFYDEGKPCGGGWEIIRDHRESTLSEMCIRNTTFRNLTYAAFAVQDGTKYWDELPWIQDNPEVADALLKVAYINVSKMPGQSTTVSSALLRHYEAWKEILFRQIDLYAPDVMVFCGTTTLQCFAKDMGLDLSSPEHTIASGKSSVDIHKWQEKKVVWAPHPAARISPAEWVDSVVEAIRIP